VDVKSKESQRIPRRKTEKTVPQIHLGESVFAQNQTTNAFENSPNSCTVLDEENLAVKPSSQGPSVKSSKDISTNASKGLRHLLNPEELGDATVTDSMYSFKGCDETL